MQNLIFANKLYDADKRTDAGPGVLNESDCLTLRGRGNDICHPGTRAHPDIVCWDKSRDSRGYNDLLCFATINLCTP